MELMFSGAAAFNQPLDKWDVSSVTSMELMFSGAAAFNQPLDKWDVSKVTDMGLMFYGAAAFNQPLDKWDVSKVKDMGLMFTGARAFNQPKFLRRCVRPCTFTNANESQFTRVHMSLGTNSCRVAHSGSAASLPLAAISTLMHVAAGGVGNAEPAKSDAAEGVVRAHGLPTILVGLKPELMARLLVVLCT
jgi:surface protein